jgi:hypothetical protein
LHNIYIFAIIKQKRGELVMNLEDARHYFNYEINDNEATKIFVLIAQNQNLKGMSYVQEITNCSDEDAQTLWSELKNQYGTKETNPAIPDLTPQQIATANAQAQEWLNKVHCPYCNSTNCKKISGVSKATSVAMFGIFLQKVKKQWHCNNCRSDF